MSDAKASYHDRMEAKWLDAKFALLDAIDDLRREVEADAPLEHPFERVRRANARRWRAHRQWQQSLRWIGQRFGELTVVEVSAVRKNGPLWRCRCDCGEIRIVREGKLRNSEITHCGKCHAPYLHWLPTTDLVGRRYGMLTVVARAPRVDRAERQAPWLCLCDCGGTRMARGYRLHNGEITDCGCIPPRITEMAVGARFGSLTVVERAGNNAHGKALWLCRCDCGVTTRKLGRDLRNGKITRCRECQEKFGVEVMHATNAKRLADTAIELRNQTLAAGGRPCARCGAPLRGARPVCRRCINLAMQSEREKEHAA